MHRALRHDNERAIYVGDEATCAVDPQLGHNPTLAPGLVAAGAHRAAGHDDERAVLVGDEALAAAVCHVHRKQLAHARLPARAPGKSHSGNSPGNTLTNAKLAYSR